MRVLAFILAIGYIPFYLLICNTKEEIKTKTDDTNETVLEAVPSFIPNAGNNPSLFTEQNKFARDLALFIQIIQSIDGMEISIREVKRTMYQQKRYVLLGLSKTYNSKHLEGLAFDAEFRYNGVIITHTNHPMMRTIANIWESLDTANEAGYFWKFKDNGHFQRNKFKGMF